MKTFHRQSETDLDGSCTFLVLRIYLKITMLLEILLKYIHRRQFFVDYTNSKGENCFSEVWLNFVILFQSEILPPNSGENPKKRSLQHSGSISVQNFDFLQPSEY